jgi:catechol 2,3-dioxygenase-like lactoylglutathione lyase family enzyme
MKVDRVLETSLHAQNLDAAELFYTRVLGLEVYSRVEDRHVFFRCGSAMLLVFNPDKTEQEQNDSTKAASSFLFRIRGSAALGQRPAITRERFPS